MKIENLINNVSKQVQTREYSNTDLLFLSHYSKEMLEMLNKINPKIVDNIESDKQQEIKSFTLFGLTLIYFKKSK